MIWYYINDIISSNVCSECTFWSTVTSCWGTSWPKSARTFIRLLILDTLKLVDSEKLNKQISFGRSAYHMHRPNIDRFSNFSFHVFQKNRKIPFLVNFCQFSATSYGVCLVFRDLHAQLSYLIKVWALLGQLVPQHDVSCAVRSMKWNAFLPTLQCNDGLVFALLLFLLFLFLFLGRH
jgi:hypothetical protein